MGYSFDPKFEQQLDHYLTTPPEPVESECHCYVCGDSLYEDDDYYRLDDEIYCRECAEEWLELHRSIVTYEMATGE